MGALGRIAAVLAVLAMAVSALAQDACGRVQGTVVDTSGPSYWNVDAVLSKSARLPRDSRRCGRT